MTGSLREGRSAAKAEPASTASEAAEKRIFFISVSKLVFVEFSNHL
jgi:hypothetical protein